MKQNFDAKAVLNFVVAKAKASEQKPLKLGNVEFWHEVPGYVAGILCYSLPVEKWNIEAVQEELNKLTDSYWDELVSYLNKN